MLPLADVNSPHRRCGRSMRLEVFNRFDLAVRGNRGDQVLLGYVVDSDWSFALAAGYERGQNDYCKHGDDDASPNVLAITVALSSVLCHQKTNKLKVYRTQSATFFSSLSSAFATLGILIRCPLN